MVKKSNFVKSFFPGNAETEPMANRSKGWCAAQEPSYLLSTPPIVTLTGLL